MRYLKTIAAAGMALGALGYAGLQATAQGGAATTQQGSYRLAELGGRPVPVLLEEEDGCREELLAATLTLAAGGEWTLTSVERESCGARAEQDEESDTGRYTTAGAVLSFTSDDRDEGGDDDADADESGEIEVDELRTGSLSGDALTVRLADERTVLVFRR
jgi:hypothetical protein